MFTCERCGSGYNANYVGVESCPRCLLLDRVQAPLSFKMLTINGSAEAETAPKTGQTEEPEEAQRVRSAK
jgi:hypothetical protein